MWKALLLYAFVAGVILVAADDTLDESATVAVNAGIGGNIAPSQDTTESADDTGSGSSIDTQATEENDTTGCAPRCREDEVYTDFKNGGCTPLTCSELGFPLKCDQRTPGCICKDGKIRSECGRCVSRDECPSCGGDPNAKSGCGSNCGKTCATFKNKPVKCPISCLFNGCDCKDGFVYDPNVKKCVLPSECTPTCGANEVFSTCINGGCDARNCSQVGKPVPCVKIDPKYCIKGCVCDKGYLRASNGTCVPKDQCGDEGCGGDPNAEPGCGVNCGRTCTSYKSKPGACPTVCVVGGCDCKKDYVFDNIVKKCVLPADCSTPPCPEGEIYSECPTVKCEGDYCPKTRDSPLTCPVGIVCDPPRCVCGFNSHRDRKTGKCIATADCPPFACNGPNEEYQPCPPVCPGENCSDYINNTTCPRYKIGIVVPCKPQCRCKKGYYRNKDNVCISSFKCDTGSCGGDPNAKPGCGVNCGKTCSTYKTKNPICPRICKVDGCDCKDGFVFDPNQQKCVPPEDCTPTCGANEVFSTCINGGCDARNCSQVGKPVPCVKIDPKYCIKGCVCDKGYLRASNGTCVPKDQCGDEGCGGDPNAEPGCGVNCGRTCTSYKSKPGACPTVCVVGGCDCKKDYVFDNIVKKCVLPADCSTPPCPEGEIYSECPTVKCEGDYCPKTRDSPLTCPVGIVCDPPRCVCGFNSHRDRKTGKCIATADCPPFACNGPNEEYQPCPPVCPGENCSDYINNTTCPRFRIGIVVPCKPQCRCKKGYYRNKDNVCISSFKCDTGSCGGDPNAKPGCGVNCGKTCSTYKTKNPICPRICKVDGCDCKDGFVFDPNQQKCVPPEDCTPTCGANEVFSTCINGGCDARNCSQVGKPVPCVKIDPKNCIKGCVCDTGYLRASNGTCVPKDQCGGEGGCGGDPNAEPGCGVNCGRTCTTYNTKSIACPLSCKVGGCDCKKGFVYDSVVNKCVLPADCSPRCGQNEIVSTCSNGGCGPFNCSDLGKPILCIDPIKCTKGCVCENTYLRAENGTCVPKEQCPGPCGGDPNSKPGCGVNCGKTCSTYKVKNPICPRICKLNGCDCKDGFVFDPNQQKCVPPEDCTPTCGLNEVYSACTNGGCDARNCSQVGKPVPCVKIDPKDCIKGCVCDEGYLRASNGTCVPKDECPPKCNGQNEFFDTCISGCASQNCSDIGKIFHCPLLPAVCRTGCRCKPGFYRNTDNVCVPESECPPRCGQNEIVSTCSNGGCGPFNCSDLGKPILCIDPRNCTKGCVCENTYLRTENGTCVPKDQCPGPCGGDPNAKPGCGVNCGKTCSTYKVKNPICPRICKPNGCDCKDGFVFDPNQEICVRPEDCTPTCGLNEVYSTCTNGGCSARNCSQVGKPVPCVKIDPKYCIKGCVCDEGYLRASNGTCVPKDQCPSKCPNPNEVFDVCPAPCPPRRCDVDDRLIRCAAPPKPGDPACNPGCRCADGYARNAKGICVPRSQCDKPENKCRENEVFNPCTRTCPPQRCGIDPAVVSCANPGPEVKCQPGCDCIDGYVRNDTDVCIPKDQCPKCTGPNEFFDTCISGCGSQNCSDIGKIFHCPRLPAVCRTGCRCNPGFYRNTDNVCVPESECPPTCGLNEVYSACTNGGCSARNCSQVGKPVPCVKIDPKYCIKGCICDTGYLRASNGTCVPKDQCPSKCPNPNEVFDVCPAPCPPRRCDVDDRVIRCAAPPKPGDPACNPGCRCADGYARNAKGICVPRSQCDKPENKCRENEVFNPCTRTCPPQRCGINPALVLCANPGPEVKCQPGCDCIDGYVRNDTDVCIPKDLCPKCTGPNEFFDTCISGCGSQNCSDIGKIFNCPLQPAVCRTGCRCNPGFYRNKDNVCVPESECPKCTGPNEYLDPCKSTCTNQTCNDIGIVRSCPAQRIEDCKAGCSCKNGFLRDANNVCIAESECQCTAPNEYLDPCAPFLCSNQTCDNIAKPYNCPKIGDCRPRCMCKQGFWRNSASVCVPANECPAKCTGQNEYYEKCISGCSNQTCNDINKVFFCPKQPAVCRTGCRCNPGFWRDAKNVCIPESQCPKCNGQNEYFDKCISDCSNETCAAIGLSYSCPAQVVCKTGCRCNPGFWRNDDNVCIPENQCPTPPCPEGETYNRCPTVKCEGDYCPKTRDSPLTCPVGIVCDPPRCVCGFNSHRDRKTGKCIATATCPPFACNGPNEEYQPCPPTCPGEKCSDYINNSKCPPFRIGIVVPCKPQCRCKKGYYRNDDNVCVSSCKCGPKNTDITTPPPTTKPIDGGDGNGSVGITSLQAGIADFTGKFLYDRIQASQGENIIVSPFSVFTPLAQLALRAVGEALKQLLAVLHLNSKEEIRSIFPKLVDSYEGQTSVNFSQAALVCINKETPANVSFKKDSVDIFRADIQNVNFADVIQAAADINLWVANKTDNYITDLVSPNMFSPAPRMILVNAIAFKGAWLYQFNEKNTQDQPFYLGDGTNKTIKLMYQEAKFNYGEFPEYGCKMLEMWYVGQNFSLVAILPDQVDGVTNLAKTLQDFTIFNKLYSSLTSQKVKVWFPKFEIRTTTDLAEILKQLNVDQIFNKTDSGLRDIIIDQEENMYVSSAVQKAVIKVKETGSEAYAANAFVVSATAAFMEPPPEIKEFRADHNFIYFLTVKGRTRTNAVPIFCGVYRKP